jgi:hypothetical protein
MTITRSLSISATPAANIVTVHFLNESTLQFRPFDHYGASRTTLSLGLEAFTVLLSLMFRACGETALWGCMLRSKIVYRPFVSIYYIKTKHRCIRSATIDALATQLLIMLKKKNPRGRKNVPGALRGNRGLAVVQLAWRHSMYVTAARSLHFLTCINCTQAHHFDRLSTLWLSQP